MHLTLIRITVIICVISRPVFRHGSFGQLRINWSFDLHAQRSKSFSLRNQVAAPF